MNSHRATLFAFLAFLLAAAALAISLAPHVPAVMGAPDYQATNPDSPMTADEQQSPTEEIDQPVQAAALDAIGRSFNYQGILYNPDGSVAASGEYTMTFRIYGTVLGGTPLHTEEKKSVIVRDGIFTVVLGDTGALGSEVFASTPRYLGITVAPDPEMQPRQRIHPVPWALQATNASRATSAASADRLVAGSLIPSTTSSDGLQIDSAGRNGLTVYGAKNDGAQLQDATRFGLSVFRSKDDGVYIQDAGDAGIHIRNPRQWGIWMTGTGNDGIQINNAGRMGYGVWGATLDGFYAQDAGRYAGHFRGNLLVTGTCSGCRTAVFGQNISQSALTPGDIVTVRGVSSLHLQEQPVLNVDVAGVSDNVIGVVYSRAQLEEQANEDRVATFLVPREGPAQPGEYVTIITYGLAQVKVDTNAVSISPGSRLTTSSQAGRAQTLSFDTMAQDELGQVQMIGTATESPQPGRELVWVLVNPR